MLLKIMVQILVAVVLLAGIYVLFFEQRERRSGGDRRSGMRGGRRAADLSALKNTGFIETSARIAQSLDMLRGQAAPQGIAPGIDAALAVSQEDIARLAGISNYRTREALKLLERQGVVRLERIGLTILDPQALHQRAVQF